MLGICPGGVARRLGCILTARISGASADPKWEPNWETVESGRMKSEDRRAIRECNNIGV